MANADELAASLAKRFGVPTVRATVANSLRPPAPLPASAGSPIAWRIIELSDEDDALLGCYECVVALFRRARVVSQAVSSGQERLLRLLHIYDYRC